MRKLYTNIEDIHIIGSPEQLTSVVTEMDKSLQNIAAATEMLTNIMLKYSETTKGNQYQKAVQALLDLRDELLSSSAALNEMQNEIVEYQNKIFRYEEMSASASTRNPYMVDKTAINADTTSVQLTRDEMIKLAEYFKQYGDAVCRHTNELKSGKEQSASFWRDSQYDIFAGFIDETCVLIDNALKNFEAYTQYLEEKIQELE